METVTTIRVRWRGYNSRDIERAIKSEMYEAREDDQALINATCMTQCCWHRAHEELLYLNPVRLRRDDTGLVEFWVAGTGGWATETPDERISRVRGEGLAQDPDLLSYLTHLRTLIASWPLRLYNGKTQRLLDGWYRLYRSRPLNPDQLDKIADSLLLTLGEVERAVWGLIKKGEG